MGAQFDPSFSRLSSAFDVHSDGYIKLEKDQNNRYQFLFPKPSQVINRDTWENDMKDLTQTMDANKENHSAVAKAIQKFSDKHFDKQINMERFINRQSEGALTLTTLGKTHQLDLSDDIKIPDQNTYKQIQQDLIVLDKELQKFMNHEANDLREMIDAFTDKYPFAQWI